MVTMVKVGAVNRRGRHIRVQVACTRLLDHTSGTTGAIVVMTADT